MSDIWQYTSEEDDSFDSDTNAERRFLISVVSTSSKAGRKKAGCRRCCESFWRPLKTLLRSSPDEHKILKSVLTFPIGIVCSIGLYYIVIVNFKLPLTTRYVIGGSLGLVLALGFALSTFVRCMVLLVVPTFFGKSGRSHIAAFAVMYLISGPVSNIMYNAGEMTDSLTCVTELLANHTAEKWKFRLKPVQDAMVQIQREGFFIKKIGKVVNQAFQPIRAEIENSGYMEKLKKKISRVDKESGQEDRSNRIEDRHRTKPGDSPGEAAVNNWEKKLDYRCEDVFSSGVQNCRNWFRNLESDCMDKLWVLGYILCLPLKLTVICEIVRGVIGLDCNSAQVVNPGLGGTYTSSRDMIENMDEGFDVNIQYKACDRKRLRRTSLQKSLTNNITLVYCRFVERDGVDLMVVADQEALDYTGAEEARKQTMHEFTKRRSVMDFVLTIFQRVLAFMFLLIFFGAYKYEKSYLADFKHDNNYITAYFRHIDCRRRKQGKMTLLPLKRIEKKRVIYPSTLTLMPSERRKLVKGTVKLVFRALISGIIIMMDYLLFWVLDLIRRHSRIDYRQEGEHRVDIRVYGKGFISEIVRLFLHNFNTQHEIENLTTNANCLPNPRQLKTRVIVIMYSIYVGLWILMYFEAFGLRLRREICRFFYRKREKKRVLYMYNDMLKKRRGFLRQMRHRVRKQVKARTLSRPLGVLQSILREFPKFCQCLDRFGSVKATCLICEDPKTPDFHDCETEGCQFTYCKDCWIDVKKKCYACQQRDDEDSDIMSGVSEEESDITDDDLFD